MSREKTAGSMEMAFGTWTVNQHDEDYLVKTTSGSALQRRCGLLSNYFDLLFHVAVVLAS